MKRIIKVNSSEISIGVEEKNDQESLPDLQIILRIERVLGGELPGGQFEAAGIVCGFSERRKIRRKAEKTNTWVRFLKLSEGRYLLLTPSLKIVDENTENLTRPELLLKLTEAEAIAEKHSRSLWLKLKNGLNQLERKENH